MLRHDAHVRPHVVSAVAKWVASVAVTDNARPVCPAVLARSMWNDLLFLACLTKIIGISLTPCFLELPLLKDWNDQHFAVSNELAYHSFSKPRVAEEDN